jgi:hypothetical protein
MSEKGRHGVVCGNNYEFPLFLFSIIGSIWRNKEKKGCANLNETNKCVGELVLLCDMNVLFCLTVQVLFYIKSKLIFSLLMDAKYSKPPLLFEHIFHS